MPDSKVMRIAEDCAAANNAINLFGSTIQSNDNHNRVFSLGMRTTLKVKQFAATTMRGHDDGDGPCQQVRLQCQRQKETLRGCEFLCSFAMDTYIYANLWKAKSGRTTTTGYAWKEDRHRAYFESDTDRLTLR
jgi:hypothetical protein